MNPRHKGRGQNWKNNAYLKKRKNPKGMNECTRKSKSQRNEEWWRVTCSIQFTFHR